MPFYSDRLQYALLRREDAPLYLSLMMNQEIMQYITGKALNKSTAQRRFDALLAVNEQPNAYGNYGVFEKNSGLFVGIGKFVLVTEGMVEIGYALEKDYWGHGYGTEISMALIHLAKTMEEVRVLEALVSPQNVPSKRILEKCQFLFFGTKENNPNTEIYRLNLNRNHSG